MSASSPSPIERAKRLAAQRAVRDHLLPTHHHIGIGSGSTVVYVVEAIAALPRSITTSMIFVPTGYQSRELIVEAGLNLGSIDTLPPVPMQGQELPGGGKQSLGLNRERALLDVNFDGADEVDEALNCIKGGGACLLQEKLVATSSRKFICVADSRKYNARLLTSYPAIPIEVVPLCAPSVLQSLRVLGSTDPSLRLGGKAKAGPVVTDNGNFIIDAPFSALRLGNEQRTDANGEGWGAAELARRLKLIVGVVETGLFCGRDGDEVAAAIESSAAQDAGQGGGQKPVIAYFGTEGGEVFVRTNEDFRNGVPYQKV